MWLSIGLWFLIPLTFAVAGNRPALPVPLVLAAIALAADALLIERALGEKDHIAHYVQVNGVLGVLIIGLWLCLWFSWQGMVVRSLIARARDPKRQ